MRSFILATAVLGLGSAAPAPQDIEFDLVYDVPAPTYSVATGVTDQVVSYDPSTVFSAALSQITASNTDNELLTATTPPGGLEKRTACAPQPSGHGPIATPDSAAGFAANTYYSSVAAAAPTPSGYTQTFGSLNASNNAYGYLGYTTLQTYDVNACAAKCNAINGCISINIYFERDPSVDPGNGNSGCANPASVTNIKCVFWGGPVNANNAVNYGQWRNQFQVVIAGSNGYTNNSVAAVPGYGTAVPLGKAAINAPYDQYGYNSYMGSAIFVGSFNAQLCADACTKKSQYALATTPKDGTPVQTCQFFNTYILYINNTDNIQGQYCAMYSESWPASYATNTGQYRGNDHFLMEYSFSYSNATNPGIAAPLPAVYQAVKDIQWPGNSASPFCASVLAYSTPVVTSTIYSTVSTTVVVTVSTTASTTVVDEVYVKRQAVATPDVLTKYPASIISSACVIAMPSPTSTSTILTTNIPTTIVITSTTTASTIQTVTVTSTSTTSTPTPSPVSKYSLCGQPLDAPLDGYGASFTVACDTAYLSGASGFQTSTSDYNACASNCWNSNDPCWAFQWDSATTTCTLYDTTGPFSQEGVSPFATQPVRGQIWSYQPTD